MMQIHNEVNKIPANNATDIKDRIFKELYENYEIWEHDKDYYHVALEIRSFDKSTGERNSIARVQMFDEKNWHMQTVKSKTALAGYTTYILHDPNKPENTFQGESITVSNYPGSDESITVSNNFGPTITISLMDLPKVGAVTVGKLELVGIKTVEQLAEVDKDTVNEIAMQSGITIDTLTEIITNAREAIGL